MTCAKYGCQGVGVGTSVIVATVAMDEILAASGRPRVCISLIADRFNDVFGKPMDPENYKNMSEAVNLEKPGASGSDINLPEVWDNLTPEQREAVIKFVKEKTKKDK